MVWRQEIKIASSEDCGVDAEAKSQRDDPNENRPRDPSYNYHHPAEVTAVVRELTHSVRLDRSLSGCTSDDAHVERVAMSAKGSEDISSASLSM
jgi:hypothetical protein